MATVAAPLLDTRGDTKVTIFSGEDKDWGLWCLRFESYTALLGWQDIMTAAAKYPDVIRMSTLGANAQQV